MSSGNSFPPPGRPFIQPPKPTAAPVTPNLPAAGSPRIVNPEVVAPHAQGSPAAGPGYAAGPGPAAGPGSPAQRPRKKKSPLPLILSIVAAVAVVAVVVAGIFVVNTVNKNQHGPAAAVQEYADAINAGDMETANDLAPVRVPQGANTDLLDPKYVESSPDKIESATVGDTQIDGDRALVTVNYKISGQDYNMQIFAQKDGKDGLFFDKWKLQGPQVQPVTLETPNKSLTVNGVDFTTKTADTVYAVFPGTYEFATPDSKYITGAKESASFGFVTDDKQEPPKVSLPASVKDNFAKDVKNLVDKKIDECIKSGKFEPAGCPFKVDTSQEADGVTVKDDVEDGDVHWKLEKAPEISASYSPTLGYGSYFTTKEGEVSFTMDSKSLGPDAWTSTKNGAFKIAGKVEIDGDQLKLTDF